MDTLFDIITWAQMQHLSDAVSHLSELVVQKPKDNSALIVAGFSGSVSLIIAILSAIMSYRNGEKLQDHQETITNRIEDHKKELTIELDHMRHELGKELKDHEYQLAYHKLLAEKRLEVYQELNNLIASFPKKISIKPEKKEISKQEVQIILENIKDYYREVFDYFKNIYFLNNETAVLFTEFSACVEKMTKPATVMEGYKGAPKIMAQLFYQIAEDSKHLHDLDLWKPKN